MLPTVARLIDTELPIHPIDGKDIWPLQADLGEGQQRGAGQRAVGRIDQSETKSQ